MKHSEEQLSVQKMQHWPFRTAIDASMVDRREVLAREVVLADEGDKGSFILAHSCGLDCREQHVRAANNNRSCMPAPCADVNIGKQNKHSPH